MATEAFDWGTPIHVYTRAQAIEDGALVDVSDQAKGYGFTVPVAVTQGAWDAFVSWGELDSRKQVPQDQAGRLHDVLWMASMAARRQRTRAGALPVQFYAVPRDGRSKRTKLQTLNMTIGGGDAGEPVITLLLEGED